MANKSLHMAKAAQNDEFYTRIEDIDEEINHYENKFRDKVVFCNCDDPKWSNFWKYFHMNFELLGLKKLITTHYEAGEVQTYKIEYMGGNDTNFEDGEVTPLQQNGDFRSDECIELLKEADIVVTNPPFSLFREYVATLMKYEKSFIIIGPKNAVTYKEIFPLIRNTKLWLGYGFKAGNAFFIVPEGTDTSQYAKGVYDPVTNTVKFRNVTWFTNIDHPKRHELIDTPYLYSKRETLYPDLYPKYDNYDAINVDKLAEIPMDYDGVMGVPITFLDKYNPDQFEIVAFRKGEDGKDLVFTREREREFNHTFVSLYDVAVDDKERRRRNQWKEYLRQNNNQAKIEPIDYFFPNSISVGGMMNSPKDTMVNGTKKYARILIKRKEI